MPIPDSELHKPSNAYLLRPASDNVHATLQAWRDSANSYEWWWLIVDHGDQQYAALRFESLRDILFHPDLDVHMNTRLADLPPLRVNPADPATPIPGVHRPHVVEQQALAPDDIFDRLRASPGGVLVVVQDGRFRGILSSGVRTFAFTDLPLRALLEEFDRSGDPDTIILAHKHDRSRR
jgi:hypothetical protein